MGREMGSAAVRLGAAVLLCCAAVACAGLPGATPPTGSSGAATGSAGAGAPGGLRVAAESAGMIWNAVAVQPGRVFVAGPRWAGAPGPMLGELDGVRDGTVDHTAPRPYPDDAWNDWHPGADPAHAFVNINSLRPDGRGGLWAVDTGAPDFGGNPLPGGAKLVRIDLATNRVSQVVPLGPAVAMAGSYVDDVRFNGDFAYLTDAGRPGLIVLDLRTGPPATRARRVLDGDPSVTAPPNRPVVLDGRPVLAPDGTPLKVNADPLEVSPDGDWLYYGPLTGPWSRIETRWLDDPTTPPAVLAAQVRPWADLPPVGGTALDAAGDLYFTDLAQDALRCRRPDGQVSTLVRDPRLHWTDAPAIDADHTIWLPVPQLDRVALFQHGTSAVHRPVQLFRYPLPTHC
jgi:hypothetical protein